MKKKIIIITCILLILSGIFLLGIPLYPHISLWYLKKTDPTDGYKYESKLAGIQAAKIDTKNLKPIPLDNRLVIPKIQVDAPILEGSSMAVTSKGLWHRPNSVTPDEIGNSVIIGHRNIHGRSTPITLYHLDQLEKGDMFMAFWEGEEIDYEVVEVKTASPNNTDIEAPTEDRRLTIYTCTLDSKNRVVVIAKPIEIGSENLTLY